MRSQTPHVAYVVHSLNAGGTERLVVDMSIEYSSTFRVSVFCLDEPGIWAARLRERGIPVYCLWRQPGLDIATAFHLANYFRKLNVDVIHAHQCTPWFYSALSRIRYSEPYLILEEHGRFFPEQENRLRRWINRSIIRKLTHRFVAVSQDIRDRLVKFEGLDRSQIDVIYNGAVDMPKISLDARRSLRRSLGFNDNEFVAGTVGRFDPIKNLPMLIESLAKASDEVHNLRGLIVGDGPIFADIESFVKLLNARHRIRLTGFRADAWDLVQCMDLFVLSSLSEGTSMALLEAIAAEVPVVVTAVGGNPEIVQHDVTGWVVPTRDVDTLAEVIVKAARSPEKAADLAKAGRKRYLEKFTFAQMIEQYRDIYAQIPALLAT